MFTPPMPHISLTVLLVPGFKSIKHVATPEKSPQAVVLLNFRKYPSPAVSPELLTNAVAPSGVP